MLSYAILIFILLALMHFIYESIFAPTVRAHARCELVVIKRKLEALKKTNPQDVDAKVFVHLREAILNCLDKSNRFEMVAIIHGMMEVEKDKELQARLEARVRGLDACKNPAAKEIWASIIRAFEKLVRANSGGWCFYVIPILVSLVCLKKVHSAAKAILSLPEIMLERYPIENHSAA